MGGIHRWPVVSPHKDQSLQWHHNGRDGISNHQPHDCLLNRLFRRRSKKTFKLRVTGLCARNSPVTGEFPAQMASNAENVSIMWCGKSSHTMTLSLLTCVGNIITQITIHRELGGNDICDPFYWHGLTLFPAWISNYIPYYAWDEIIYLLRTSTVHRWSLGMDR